MRSMDVMLRVMVPHPDLLVLREPAEGDGIRKPSGYGALGLAVAGLDFSLLRT